VLFTGVLQGNICVNLVTFDQTYNTLPYSEPVRFASLFIIRRVSVCRHLLLGHTAPHHTNSDLFASSSFAAADSVYEFIIEVYKLVTLQAGRTIATEERVSYYALPYRRI